MEMLTQIGNFQNLIANKTFSLTKSTSPILFEKDKGLTQLACRFLEKSQ